ncbi:MAG: MATE family efflux transporter [Lachnospiraceae bacterium]|nr:MATE family efflux transporter [Lachnospiraceae bacterium]
MNTSPAASHFTKINRFLDSQLSSTMFSRKEILGMLFPLILDNFFINAIGMLTTSMISSSGQASVSAVSLIGPITTLVLCLLNAIAAGGTVVVAQSKGKAEHQKIKDASAHTLTATVGTSLVVCILLAVFASPTVHLLYGSAEPLVIEKSIEYLAGVSISLIIYAVYAAIFAIFRGLGENKICLNLTVYINLSYFIFSYIFINLLHLDIMGTVWALILARLLGAFVSVYYLFLKKKRILYIKCKELLQFHGDILRAMLKISVPFGLEQLFLYGGSILVQMYMVDLGTAAIAANAIGTALLGIAYAAPQAVGNLSTTVIGQCIGAGDQTLARWYGKQMIRLSNVLILISLVIFIPLMSVLTGLFHPEPETTPLILRLMWIALIPMPFFWSMSNIMPCTLRSAGDATYASVVSLITMWFIRVGAGYLAAIPLGFGMEGAWVCMSLEWVVRTFLFYLRFKGEQWLNQKTI